MARKPVGLRRRRNPIGIIYGAGAYKGAGHIGVSQAIEELDIDVGMMTGVSIGAWFVAFKANGYSDTEIKEIFLHLMARLANRYNSLSIGTILSLLRGGLVDILQLAREVVAEYKLKPQPNMRILAYNLLTRRPVKFEGTNYDLALALAASSSIPVIMPHVWMGQLGFINSIITLMKGVLRQTDEGILIDGGVHHPNPADFEPGPAIISKLGFASQLSSEWLSPLDLAFHLMELSGSILLEEWIYPDPTNHKHIVIPAGMPDVACLTFGRLSQRNCQQMIDYARSNGKRILTTAIADGLIPVKPKRRH